MFLLSQMDKLEKVKPALGADTSKDKGYEICKNYALNVFNKADQEDRDGVADKATAKIFYSAGSFFDILEQFGDLAPELQEKKVYAKWKATEILNAIKEGRQATPGGFGEQSPPAQQLGDGLPPSAPSAPLAPATSTFNSIINSVFPTQQQQPQQQQQNQQPSFFHSSPASASAAATAAGPRPGVINVSPPVNNLDPRVKDSIELCLFAVAALKVSLF